jgi:hypothetical protein
MKTVILNFKKIFEYETWYLKLRFQLFKTLFQYEIFYLNSKILFDLEIDI